MSFFRMNVYHQILGFIIVENVSMVDHIILKQKLHLNISIHIGLRRHTSDMGRVDKNSWNLCIPKETVGDVRGEMRSNNVALLAALKV